MIADSKADIYFRATDYLIDHRFVDFTSAMASLLILPTQLIEQKITKSKYTGLTGLVSFFSELIPSFSFLILIMVGLFAHFGLLAVFLLYFKKFNRNRLVSVLVFSFVLFFFFIEQFFSGNLNAMNVIVDVSDLLYSKEKVLNTDKEPCFLEGAAEIEYYIKVSDAY